MTDEKLAALKAQHKRLVVCELDGVTLAFKPLNKAKLIDLKKTITSKPDLACEFSINACEFCCVFGRERFSELADLYPIAFCGSMGSPGVIDHLMDLARGDAQIRVE
jgi:hypothetical protein